MKPVPRGLNVAREAFTRLHACPEPAGHETVSSAVVADLCQGIGATVTTGVGGHGVIARIGSGEPVVAFRAELDALATSNGAEHLCGHDLHAAALVGALAALQAGEAPWTGSVLAIFQPAEETGTGAAAMVASGIDRLVPTPTVLLAQHSSPLPHDVVAFRPGPVTSWSETASIELTARGGHPGLAGSERHALTVAFSRLVYGVAPTIGQVTQARLGGAAWNALPNSAAVTVDLRAPDEASLSARRQALGRVLDQVGVDGVELSTAATRAFAGVSNDPDAAALLYRTFAQRGRTAVLMPGPSGTSDDVGGLAAAFSAPLVYWFWGTSGSSQMPASDHAALAAGRAPVTVPANHSPLFSASARSLDSGLLNLLIALSAWSSPRSTWSERQIEGPARARSSPVRTTEGERR
ncbi:M20/M25/M40 family metallo-hydrolase [Curtobacterium aurantiacum]|uniref:M20/M25/M40 family metallo-hydrolase n=1 Tax=Curtobacterium aurantiacum TaxID=3236919 RepID=A0ABS5VHF7_9MICO|nr:M20/M25/M40 family metallo-hydrolase [Curtobacterium flaccumfaciens]MBT1546316.1 M20/M25/M40 family metallo-hydrolase [Curtobacterium flaccumfaciens pv. flaccumfaciens]MBT1588321.1 M20/M25/M40 family metallo-hydrolase [Curtobacterium flaccumfaciens pv. flaccumfaciens]